jgi:membrane protein DedA with SNARE-associated domain
VTAILFCVGLALILALEEAGLFFLPGDISLVAAGVHSREVAAFWFLPLACLLATCAMSLGATVLFRGVQHSGRLGRVIPERVRIMIQRHGAAGIFGARIFPGLRNATVFAAASSHLPYRTFLIGLVPAAALWSVFLLLLGWAGGPAMLAAFHAISEHPVLKVASFALLGCGLLFVAIRVWTTATAASSGLTRASRSGRPTVGAVRRRNVGAAYQEKPIIPEP